MFIGPQAERLAESSQNSFANGSYLGDRFPGMLTKVADQYDYKLIAAQSGYCVSITHTGDKAGRDLPKQHVAKIMAEGVIEQFEIIQINEQ
jgi:hypothetical protein